MNRIPRVFQNKTEKVVVEKPNWAIKSLYNDRQLIRNKKLTKFFIPFDSTSPDNTWKMFFFGDGDKEEQIEFKSATTLIGRESFCDLILNDYSVSRQHCAIQFRSVRLSEDDPKIVTRPYIFDLVSKGGTFINDELVPPMCFVELKNKDSISFAKSSENIVLMQILIQEETNYDE